MENENENNDRYEYMGQPPEDLTPLEREILIVLKEAKDNGDGPLTEEEIFQRVTVRSLERRMITKV